MARRVGNARRARVGTCLVVVLLLAGCVDVGGGSLTLGVGWTLGAGADRAVAGVPVTFHAAGPAGGQNAAWSFGDGERAQGETVTHTFIVGGVYTVAVTSRGLSADTRFLVWDIIDANGEAPFAPPPSTARDVQTLRVGAGTLRADFEITYERPANGAALQVRAVTADGDEIWTGGGSPPVTGRIEGVTGTDAIVMELWLDQTALQAPGAGPPGRAPYALHWEARYS